VFNLTWSDVHPEMGLVKHEGAEGIEVNIQPKKLNPGAPGIQFSHKLEARPQSTSPAEEI
jgi:hypothetical protein